MLGRRQHGMSPPSAAWRAKRLPVDGRSPYGPPGCGCYPISRLACVTGMECSLKYRRGRGRPYAEAGAPPWTSISVQACLWPARPYPDTGGPAPVRHTFCPGQMPILTFEITHLNFPAFVRSSTSTFSMQTSTALPRRSFRPSIRISPS